MLTPSTIEDFEAHAFREAPKECNGLVVVAQGHQFYVPCANIAEDPVHDFAIAPEDFAAASDLGSIVGVCHSHAAPDTEDNFTATDMMSVEKHKLPWYLFITRTRTHLQTRPNGFSLPLVGRTFCFGVVDCYTLVRDYYREVHGIELADYPRRDNFEDRGEELYLDNFRREGFYEIEEKDLKPGDAILMKFLSKGIVNHAAIYVEDGVILHHARNTLSGREVYGGIYRKCASHFLRHRDL